jgi:hypothetical protein
MAVNIVCPECRARCLLPDEEQGKQVRCPKCLAVFLGGAAQPPTQSVMTAEVAEVVTLRPRSKETLTEHLLRWNDDEWTPPGWKKTVRGMIVVLLIFSLPVLFLGEIGRYCYFARLEKDNEIKAKAQITLLSMVIKEYMRDHQGQPPGDLKALLVRDATGFGPYLEDELIITTPWGGTYLYDRNGPNNRGVKPDVWVDGPRGTIGNWKASR